MKPEQQNITSKQPPRARFVDHLPDLINPEDYCRENNRKKIRVQIKITDQGIEIVADSPYPFLLDKILAQLEVPEIEKMLCG